MYAWIRGKIVRKNTNHAVVAIASGLGYAINMLVRDIDSISINSEIELHLFHHIRENKEELYGFVDVNDVMYFEKLLSVSGVGPATALDIMNSYPFDIFLSIIDSSDVTKLCSVKGVGKKGAQRIIVELAGKLALIDESNSDNEKLSELKSALKSLGFGEGEVTKMIKSISIESMLNDTVEELIKYCLSNA